MTCYQLWLFFIIWASTFVPTCMLFAGLSLMSRCTTSTLIYLLECKTHMDLSYCTACNAQGSCAQNSCWWSPLFHAKLQFWAARRGGTTPTNLKPTIADPCKPWYQPAVFRHAKKRVFGRSIRAWTFCLLWIHIQLWILWKAVNSISFCYSFPRKSYFLDLRCRKSQ